MSGNLVSAPSLLMPPIEAESQPQGSLKRSRLGVLIFGTLLVSSVAVVALWLLDVSGNAHPDVISRLVVVAWILSLQAFSVDWVVRCWRAQRWHGMVLPALLLLSFVVRLIGIDWEAGEGYYRDEGIYHQAAQNINAGQLLPESFIYGHLLYYLAALALWLQSLFPSQVSTIAQAVFAVETEDQVMFVVLRSLSATLGALTTIPVYLIARRLAGRLAGVLAAFLIIFSTLYNEVTHLLISDVPSAFFATLCLLFVARLIDRESQSDYLWAGACAGLAAASKWPAGVVAIAIIAAWVRWRISKRDWNWSLLAAGLASIAALLVVMPALLFDWRDAFANEGRAIFFGFQQYGRGGWIGVVKESNSGYYVKLLLDSFKIPAAALGITGLFFLAGNTQRRLFWNLAFPIAYLALIISMSMAVKRNLLPVVPVLAVVLGVGATGWLRPLARVKTPQGAAVAGLLGIILTLPVWATVLQQRSMTSVSTRQLAVDWINENVPRGATFVKESYTPKLDPAVYVSIQGRFVARRELDEIRKPEHDFLLLAWNAYGRFTNPDILTKPHHVVMAERYSEMFTWDKVRDFDPGKTRGGPFMMLYRLEPAQPQFRTRLDLGPADAAFLSNTTADSDTSPTKLVFGEGAAWALFKSHLEQGTYILEAKGEWPEGSGRIRIVTRDNEPVADLALGKGALRLEIPARNKFFLYVELPSGSELESLSLDPAT